MHARAGGGQAGGAGVPARRERFRTSFVALLFSAQGCGFPCLSCACEEDADCAQNTACVDRVCVATCDENDCDPFFVCDLDNGVCIRDACTADDDCAVHEDARCDDGFCVARQA